MAPKRPSRRAGHRPSRATTKITRRCRPALEPVEPRLLLTAFAYFVDALTDTGAGTGFSGDLRYAITQANLNPGSTITIDTSGTVDLTSALPNIAADTSIGNPDPGDFLLQGGGPTSDFNALTINNGVTATIDGLDFTNFHSSGTGGILDVEGMLTLDNSDLGNSSASNGGAVFVDSEGSLTTDQTNFHDDSANGVGGALFDFNSAVLNGGSFLNNNASDFGGAVYNGGYLVANGVEFAGNLSETSGGAIYSSEGMGVVTPYLLIENSTIDSNTALSDGGGIASDYSVKLRDDTIANNTSGSGANGAGYYNANSSITPGFYNTIVAQNFAGTVEDDVDGSTNFYAASSYNLIGNTTLGGISDGSQGNQIGTSGSPLQAGLAARADNGGDSDTLALNPGSPALGAGLIANAVNLVTGDPLPFDQRGVGFPRVVNGLIDIGAFQTQVAASNLAVSAATGVYGRTTTVSATLTSGGDPVAGEMVDLHIGATDLGNATTDVNGLATLGFISFGSLGVGTYTNDVTASFAGDSNFGPSSGSADLTVTPAPLTITADDQTKVYGAVLPTLTASYTGFVNGDTAASLTTAPTIMTTADATSHVDGSPYAITASGAVDPNYTITYAPGNLTVTAAPLTITADDQTKVYGDALPILSASYSGFVNGDTAADLTTAPTITTTADATSHVSGSPYAITASGAADSDYMISYAPGNLTVTAAPLTITADDQTKVYGAALPTLTASYSGFVNDDTAADLITAPTIATTATAASHVDGNPYAITASGAVDDDYTITYAPGNLTVTAAPLTITADDQTKVYGAALPMLTASYTEFVNGDTAADLTTAPTITTTADATSHVSGNPYAITASGAVDSDYTISYAPGNLTVTAAPLTITADDQTKVYGAALPMLTASYSGFVNDDTAADLTTAPTVTTTATAASHVSGNPYAITASGAVDDDYTISYGAGNLTVTPAPLTITADDQTKVYGAALPTLTVSDSGLVNGDTSADLGTMPTVSTTAGLFSDVSGSPYAITASGAVDDDYTISYAAGSLTVTPAPLTITIDDRSKVYGQDNPTLTGTVTGVLNGDAVTANYTTSATQYSDVVLDDGTLGGYAITLSGLAGARAQDYSTTAAGGSVTPGTLTVSQAPLTVVVADRSKVYGQLNPAFSGVVTGVLDGDDVTVTYLTGAGQYSDVQAGGYEIGVGDLAGAKAQDYTTLGTVTPGTLTITPAPLTIAVNNQSKVYGQDNPTLTGTVTGVLNGDAVTALYSTMATTSSGVVAGGYPITASGLSGVKAGDYTIAASTPGTLTITPAPLTIAADDQARVYGQGDPAFTASYDGFVLGQDPTDLTGSVGFTTPATAASHVGGYAIDPGGLSSPDYTINFVPGTLAVTPAPLTITPVNVLKTYGLAVPTLTAVYSGFVNGDTSASLTTPLSLTTPVNASTHFGVYPIAASGAADPDYAISYAPGAIAVTPAILVVTPTNMIIAYGNAVPTLTATYSGFVNGDTAASLTSPVELSNAVTAGSPVGVYYTTASGGASADYTILYAPGAVAVVANPGPVAFVTSLYQTILGRAPETAGLITWLTMIGDGTSESDVASLIYNSPEAIIYRAQHRGHTITENAAYRQALAAQAQATTA